MKRVLLLLIVALLGWAWLERQALADFPGILSAYSAKEYCSCRFVMGFDEAYCRGYVKQWLPLSRLEEDGPQRRRYRRRPWPAQPGDVAGRAGWLPLAAMRAGG